MCTVTARYLNDCWQITMNRDEVRSRPEAELPFVWPGKFMIAPRDPVGGGTWIGARHDGTWACLLNGYNGSSKSKSAYVPKTRGRLVPLALASEEPLKKVLAEDLSSTESFRLWLAEDEMIKEIYWDGIDVVVTILPQTEWYFVTSSSLDQNRIKKARRQVFEEWLRGGCLHDEALIPLIHTRDPNLVPEESILMDRDYSATQSITQIRTRSDGVDLRYWKRASITKAPDRHIYLDRH